MSLDMIIEVGETYLDEFKVEFIVTGVTNRGDHRVCAIAAHSDVGIEPVRWYGSENEFMEQFNPIDPMPLPTDKTKYSFSELDSYSLEDLQGIRKKLRDDLTTEIHKRDALKAEILFLCTEIDKYKHV